MTTPISNDESSRGCLQEDAKPKFYNSRDQDSRNHQLKRWMSSLLFVYLTISQTITLSKAFNIDTQSAIVHQGPADSYFGFTVAQHRDRSTNWLLVGAPKAKTEQPGVKEAGAVYRCSVNTQKACQKIPFDLNGSSVIQLRNESRQSDDKSYQWFGASLASATENGSIIACAPKYVYYSTNLRRRDPVGTCWVSRGSFAGFLEYSPCRINEQWGHHHLGSCQAGFSSAISKDGSRLFMGAPGSHVWQGQAFQHNLKTDATKSTSSVNPHSEDDSYLGYSLALGKFGSSFSSSSSGSEGSAVQDVAIGIPRGADLLGKVMLVDGREMKYLRNITGEQMASYFGYSLAVADVNADGLDDLIIGAPLYYNQTMSHKEAHFERGRVYVALQNARHEFSISQRIDGLKNRARFGTSLANCGDLNRDGFQDVAIGAPYDGPEMRGAVYIFMGRKEAGGLSQEHDQVIYANQLPRQEGNQMKSFGFALSAGLDLDGNAYPDLVVGDYEASRAVILKTRPVINVTTSISFQPEYFNLDDKNCLLPNTTTKVSCITVQYCTKYTGLNVDNRLNFVYDVKLDTENQKAAPRLFFLNQASDLGKTEERNTTLLTKDVNQCKTFKAYINGQIRDKLTPLKIDIDYNLADYIGDQYDYNLNQPKLRPILNLKQSNKISKVALIQKNCGYDNVCIPDLKLSMVANLDQYIIGSNERIILDVLVKNYGEDAYESMFYLTMPMTINFININKTRQDGYPICYGAKPDQTGTNILTCDLGNPQQRNDAVKFSVITEPARGQITSSDFTFIATVNSTNPELDDKHREDNTVPIGIPIKVDVDLVVTGNSNPPLIVHNSSLIRQNSPLATSSSAAAAQTTLISANQVSEADIGPEVFHVYQVQNKGPSTINDVAVTILWPTKIKNGAYLLYLVDEPVLSDKVKCKPIADDAINPLNLKYFTGNKANYLQAQSVQSNSNKLTQYTAFGYRNKRQTPSLDNQQSLAPASTTVDNSVLQQLTCGPTECTRFDCNVFDLGHNEIATIKIRSRLYEETVNYLSLQEFDISSNIVAQVKLLPHNISSSQREPKFYKVVTQVHTTSLAVQDLLPWWLIALAILLGIVLFILLAWFLKFLGFFDRRKPPKGVEREPLTPAVWNDYQYTPGDTAL